MVFGTDEDDERLDAVYRILFPNSDPHDKTTNRARRKLRDAMHVATAIRYGGTVFITRDGKDLVSKVDEISEAFNGFKIMLPETALTFALRIKDRYDHRHGS